MVELVASLNEEYRLQLQALAGLLERQGYRVKPFKDPSLPNFNLLSDHKKTHVLQALRAYTEALNDVSHFDDDIDMSHFVWRFLLRLGIAPSEDLFDIIKDESFIQIYSDDQFQIFRSLRCFERCSFTLEELTTRSWWELWERDSLFYFALIGLATKILQFIRPEKLRLDFPYHKVKEINSESLFEFRYKIKTVSVLTKQKRTRAALLVEDWQY